MSESGRIKRYCVFGCDDLGAPMHSFPHPVRRPELFRTWLSIVGDRFKETDPLKIYRNKKICDHHFTSDQKVACHRLMYEAVPSVNLEAAVSKSSCILEIEHNYCIPNSFQQNQSNNKDVQPALKPAKLDSDVTDAIETGDHIDTDAFDNNSPSSPAPELGQTPENIFSWQTEELIEADSDDPTTPVPEESKLPDDVVTLSLFCDYDTPIQSEPSAPEPFVVPEDVGLQCKDCAAGIDRYSFWCVQCACGALCGACAASATHDRHYVLRAPGGATQNQTQALLAVIRQQLLMENLLTLYDTDEDRVKVKEEPVEPAATTDPVSVRPHTDPLNVRPHTDLLNAGPHTALLNVGPHTDLLNVGPHLDPLNVGPHTDPLSVGPHYNPLTAEPYEATVNECAGEGTVDHPYKRPRLMDYRTGVKPNSTSTIDGDVPQQFLNVSPNIRRTVQAQDFLMATTSNLRESQADLLVNNDLKRTQTLIQIDPTNVKEFQTKVMVDPSDSEQLQTVLLIDPSDFRVKTVQQVTSDVRESLDVIQVIPSILRVSQGVLQIPSHLKRSQPPKRDFQQSHSSVYENSIRDYIESEVDDSDLDEDYRVEKDLIDEDSINETDEEDIAGGVGRRTRKATNMIRGPSEVMLRTLTSEAAVQLQPLTSSDIRKWIHRKTRRKD